MTNNNYNLQGLVELLEEANEEYRKGTPIISDEEYDDYKKLLKDNDPGNPLLDNVGFIDDDGYGVQIKHEVKMLSIDDRKTPEKVYEWLYKFGSNIETYSMPKLDGNSGKLVYDKNGKLEYISTRGNGEYGRLIELTEEVLNNPSIPKNIDPSLNIRELRGEFIIPKRFNDIIKGPLRNVCRGYIVKSNKSFEKYVDFVVFSGIDNDLDYIPPIKLFKHLPSDIKRVPISLEKDIDKLYNDYISSMRDQYEYETDGLVIHMKNDKDIEEADRKYIVRAYHHYNIALKPPAKGKWTIVTGVLYQVSKFGKIIRVLTFNPINIDGVEISRSSVDLSHEIYIGSKVFIIRSNDVIPYVMEIDNFHITNEKKIEYPNFCPSCGKGLIKNGAFISCPSPENCPSAIKKLILHWCKNTGIKNIGDSTIDILYDNKIIVDVTDLYRKDLYNKMIKLEGFQHTGVSRIVRSISNGMKNIKSDLDILSNIGINGIRKLKLEKYKLGDIETFKEDVFKLYESVGKDEVDTISKLVRWTNKKSNIDKIKRLKSILGTVPYDYSNKNLIPVSITGKSNKYKRSEIEEILTNLGYVNKPLNRNTRFLIICGDDYKNKSKYNAAIRNGIPIRTIEDVIKGI